MATILIIDPSRAVRNSLKEMLEYEGFTVYAAEDLHAGMGLLGQHTFDLVICGDCDARFRINVPWIILSDEASVEQAVEAIRNGAADFIPKPVDMNHLLRSVRQLCEEHRTDTEPSVEDANIEPSVRPKRMRCGHVEEIIGASRQILHVKRLIDKVAPSDARVLIMGANGTGKELVARWLHEKSPRSEGPFVEVNCAAIPSELIESELFGHEKGAFTSAIKQRKGKFEQAIGGTLFLDEVGDMSLSAQAKVLRALQESKISRVGSDKDIDVDVRVVAATNKNLRYEIDKGNFREDLYHRLSVIVIEVPPLAERKDDIPLLVDYFLDKICAEYGIEPKSVDREAIERLKIMSWTGNIRELRNVIERLIILSGDRISLEDVDMYAVSAL